MLKTSLTHPQKRIWFSEKLYPGTNLYNISVTFRFEYSVDFDLLNKAINYLVQVSDGLRLTFMEINGEPVQKINNYIPFTVPLFDFSKKGGEKKEDKWIKKETSSPFNLINSNLYRFYMIRYSNGDEGFLINCHHIICDGWTNGILGDRVKTFYEKLNKDEGLSTQDFPSYLSFIKNEKEYLKSKRFEMNRIFWRDYLLNLPEPLNYPTLENYSGVKQAERFVKYLPSDFTGNLNTFCQEQKISLFTLFFSVLSIYIFRITGQEDFIIGTPTHNRTGSAEKQTAGMFVNLLPYRQKMTACDTFQEIIKQVSRDFISLFRNQKYPFNLLMEDIRSDQNFKQNLFKVIFSYENKPVSINNHWHFNGLESFPLVIHLVEREGSERPKWEIDYQSDLFQPEDIQSLYNSLITLVKNGINYPEKKSQPAVPWKVRKTGFP